MDKLMHNYGSRDLTLVKGEGSRVWDDRGQSYLDAISGIAVCGLGHAHPAVTRAICDQADQLLHVSNLYNIPPQQELAERLCAQSGMDRAFFANSGAEANEAALKIARKVGHERGIDKPAVVVMENSFHGRTLATLSATGNRKVQEGFEPLLEGFIRLPFDDPDALRRVAQEHTNIVAVLVEPIQGEGGIRVPTPDYLKQLRRICDQYQWLLMLDEIQTGNGRTGRYFAYQHQELLPDLVTTAKGLGNGVPIGACLARGPAAEVLQAGSHGSTFGGNPLACRAGLAVMETLENEALIARAEHLGRWLLTEFKHRLDSEAKVVEVRGLGLMLGIELNRPCAELVAEARAQGLLINVTAGKTLRLLPPLILTDTEAERLANGITQLIKDF
mgnify:CR=1 FL=1